MDDTFIYSAVPTDADTVIGVSDAVTAMSLDGMTMSGTFGGSVLAEITEAIYRLYAGYGVEVHEYKVAEPPKPEAAPKKPPPSLPVEAWAAREFDAEQAHAATLALCRGQ